MTAAETITIETTHTPPAHMPALDGLRGLAILAVLLFHAIGDFSHPANFMQRATLQVLAAGWVGVDLFFVLSGFLITGILLASRNSTAYFRSFFARRVLRIFPLYYVVLLLLLADAHRAFHWPDVASLLFFYYNLHIVHIGSHRPLVMSFWSLAVEEQFYILWPLLVLRCSDRALRRICIIGIAIALVLRIFVLLHSTGFQDAYYLTPCRMDELLAGALLAIWRSDEQAWKRVQRYATTAGLVAAAGIACVWIYTGNFFDSNIVSQSPSLRHSSFFVLGPGMSFVMVLFAALVAKATHQGAVARVFLNWPLRRMGKYSYGIYVLHEPLLAMLGLHWVPRFLPGRSDFMQHMLVAPLLVVLSFAAAWVSFHCFEKHFLKLKRRFPAWELFSPQGATTRP